MKKLLKTLLAILLALIVIAGGYLAYVFIAYYRLDDNLNLPIYTSNPILPADSDKAYRIVSWNIGFGAYEDDYGFFMDGGTQSWAWSRERLYANLENIGLKLADENADFLLVQEIDINSTRSYHVDEFTFLLNILSLSHKYSHVFAQNYDSPFLFYPLTQPHGASKAGIGTYSEYAISSAVRRSLPIETGFTKLIDLDRCYSVSRFPMHDGSQIVDRELVLYNLHLSAYTSDGTIATEQLKLLLADMQAEYEKGNYTIAGGDFNKDILGDSSVYFGASDIEYTWAQPIPADTFDGVDIRLVAPIHEDDPVPSCRNADSAYHEGQYVLTVDGFLVSPNVTVKDANVVDYAFKYSDHNPVYMGFMLE